MSVHETNDKTEAILVFRIGSLGDTVAALPALHELRRKFPRSRIVLLTNSPVDGGIKAISSTHLLSGMGLVDESIIYPHGSLSVPRILSVIRQIRAKRTKICYFLIANRTRIQAVRDRIFFRLSGVRKIIGLDRAVAFHLAPSGTDEIWESEAKRGIRAIGATARRLEMADFSLGLTQNERAYAEWVLRENGIEGPFIAISLGSKIPVKDWGDSRWSECLRILAPVCGGQALVAFGSMDEAERSAGLLRAWPYKTANLCGQLSPRQSAAAIERARLFLGHDSGPMHLASAVGTPTVAVFSARVEPGIWFPFGQEANVFYKSLPCRGCRLDVCIKNEQRCVTQIIPAEVAMRAQTILLSPTNRTI